MQIVIGLVSFTVMLTAISLGLVFGLRVAKKLPKRLPMMNRGGDSEVDNGPAKALVVYLCVVVAVAAAAALLLIVFAPLVN